MDRPQQIFADDEEATLVVSGEERTLVAPRFDDEETVVARPVIPLGAVERRAPEAPSASNATPATHAPARRLPRGAMLPLMLASVLVGGVLGGAGLYLYQRQASESKQVTTAEPSAATSQPAAPNQTPNDASQPAPAAETPSPTPEAQPADSATNAPDAGETNTPDGGGSAEPDSEHTGAAPARESESAPAAGAPKRGKKGAHDEEIERSPRRANRADSGAPLSRADSDAPEARRVDSIFYRPRRASRDRARRQTPGDAERLRRIFEGTPER